MVLPGLRRTSAALLLLAATPRIVADLAVGVPLREDLGDVEFYEATASARGKQYFDQGFRYLCAADLGRAASSFQEASRLDARCSLCLWGEALALGPGLYSFDDPAPVQAVPRAAALTWRAVELSRSGQAQPSASESLAVELAEALAARYEDGENGTAFASKRPKLDVAYARAMDAIVRSQSDLKGHLKVLAAEAWLMTLRWDYWEINGSPALAAPNWDESEVLDRDASEGQKAKPKPAAERALELLRAVLHEHPDHPYALRLFVHTAGSGPEAVPETQPLTKRLESVMPGAPHLWHLAGHVKLIAGDFQGAIRSHLRAVRMRRWQVFPLHHLEGLVFALRAAGWLWEARKASRQLKDLAAEYISTGTLEMGCSAERYVVQAVLSDLLAGDFTGVLHTSAPAPEQRFSTGVWLFARGMARLGIAPLALQPIVEELGPLAMLPNALRVQQEVEPLLFGRLPAADVIQVYSLILQAFVQDRTYPDVPDGVKLVRRAAKAASLLPYDEVPCFYLSPRLFLGQALLAGGDVFSAKTTFEEELAAASPFRPFALFGLRNACEALRERPGLAGEAANQCVDSAASEIDSAWADADGILRSPTQAYMVARASHRLTSRISRKREKPPSPLAGVAAALVAVGGAVLACKAQVQRTVEEQREDLVHWAAMSEHSSEEESPGEVEGREGTAGAPGGSDQGRDRSIVLSARNGCDDAEEQRALLEACHSLRQGLSERERACPEAAELLTTNGPAE